MPRGQYDRSKAQQAKPSASADSADARPTMGEAETSPRALEARRERRMRDSGDLDRGARMKLAIPQEVQERLRREGKTARWILDDKNRLIDMHNRDWDRTPGVEPVPSGEDGLSLVLHEKYADWYDADQRAKEAILDKKDAAIKRGDIDGSGQSIARNDLNDDLARANRIR